jgi:excisionase family DNA binding protein
MSAQPTVGSLPAQPVVSEWLTASEAAQYLRIKTRTLLLWVRQGRVKGFALSGTRVWRFRRQDLDAAMMDNSVLPFTTPSVCPEERVRIQ